MAAGPPGGNPPQPAARPAPTATVAAVLDGYLGDLTARGAKPNTARVTAGFFTPFRRGFGGRPAAGVRPHDVEAFARRPAWSAATQNAALTAIVSAFRWAARAGLIPANPLDGVRKPPKRSRGADAVISPDDFAKLCDAAPAAFRPFLRGLWLTGARPGELARLTAADVDFTAGVAVLAEHKAAGVTGRPRLIFLSPDALGLLRRQADLHPAGPLFRNRAGNPWSAAVLAKAVRRVRERAGVPRATAYGFRHTYATAALCRGLPDATVAALLGHSGTAMLHRHYSHLTSQARHMRDAAGQVRA